jgi:hypothetical protein
MADKNKLSNIALGQLNPGLSSRSRNPVVRQSTITDDPMAIYKKSVRNSVATDSLEGVSVLRGIVVGAFVQDSEEGWLSRILPFLDSDSGHTVIRLVCMIPEMHAHLGNPFIFFSSPMEYVRRTMRLPVYDYHPAEEEALIPIGIGSIVEVTFTDPDRTQGFVSRIIQPLDELLKTVQGAFDAHSGGDAIPLRTNLTCEEASPDPTADSIYGAYESDGMTPELADEIVKASEELNINPAWLANAMHFESGYTFDPSKQHRSSTSATGLIQITDSTAKELGTTTSALQKMSAVEQMEYVVKYFNLGRIPPMTSQEDVYMAIYFPESVGQGSDFDIYQWHVENKGPRAARQYLRNNKGTRTVGDYVSAANSRAKLPC